MILNGRVAKKKSEFDCPIVEFGVRDITRVNLWWWQRKEWVKEDLVVGIYDKLEKNMVREAGDGRRK